MSGKSYASLAFFGMATLCLMQASAAQSSGVADRSTRSVQTALADPFLSEDPQPHKVLLIMGLRVEANELVSISVSEELSNMEVESVDVDTAASEGYQWPTADLYLAAGTRGCQVALESIKNQRTLCTLLTEEGFLSLGADTSEHDHISALVIDQPVSRQARIAHHIYPSLSRFSTFSGAQPWTDGQAEPLAVDSFSYINARSLPSQLSDALSSHDALIATSDSSVFNSSTLSTVLLTAYGYHKPVIGFSRAYVKAGALISSYTTPAQILREVSQMLDSGSIFLKAASPIRYPRYFSVIDNMSVAKSLGLIRESRIVPGQTLSDEDFER